MFIHKTLFGVRIIPWPSVYSYVCVWLVSIEHIWTISHQFQSQIIISTRSRLFSCIYWNRVNIFQVSNCLNEIMKQVSAYHAFTIFPSSEQKPQLFQALLKVSNILYFGTLWIQNSRAHVMNNKQSVPCIMCIICTQRLYSIPYQ